jgi:hypothetical protein
VSNAGDKAMLAAIYANMKRETACVSRPVKLPTDIFCKATFFISTKICRPRRQVSFTKVNYCVIYNY